VKVRGTASTIYEKYTTLARDAASSGNRVKAENYRQHGEHYLRLMNIQEAAKLAAQQEREAARQARGEANNNEGEDGEDVKPRRQRNPRRDRNDNKKEATKSEGKENSDAGEPTALEVVTPKAETTDEDVPKRRRKAPARKAESSETETVDAAE